MQLTITKEDEKIIIKSDKIIESYDLETEVTFKALIGFLLGKNLSDKMIIVDNVESKSEADDNLIKIIKDIIDNYNCKVDDYIKFVDDYEKKLN